MNDTPAVREGASDLADARRRHNDAIERLAMLRAGLARLEQAYTDAKTAFEEACASEVEARHEEEKARKALGSVLAADYAARGVEASS